MRSKFQEMVESPGDVFRFNVLNCRRGVPSLRSGAVCNIAARHDSVTVTHSRRSRGGVRPLRHRLGSGSIAATGPCICRSRAGRRCTGNQRHLCPTTPHPPPPAAPAPARSCRDIQLHSRSRITTAADSYHCFYQYHVGVASHVAGVFSSRAVMKLICAISSSHPVSGPPLRR